TAAGRRQLAAQAAIGVEIVRSELRTFERKSLLLAPAAAVPQPSIRRFPPVAAPHDEQLDRAFLFYTVVVILEPAVIPAQPPGIPGQGRLLGEFDFAGRVLALAPMRPGADDQPLWRFLALGQGLPVQNVLPAPGVIP